MLKYSSVPFLSVVPVIDSHLKVKVNFKYHLRQPFFTDLKSILRPGLGLMAYDPVFDELDLVSRRNLEAPV